MGSDQRLSDLLAELRSEINEMDGTVPNVVERLYDLTGYCERLAIALEGHQSYLERLNKVESIILPDE